MKVPVGLIRGGIFPSLSIVSECNEENHDEKTFVFYLEILHDLSYPFHHQHLWQELTGLSCPSTNLGHFRVVSFGNRTLFSSSVFDARQPLPLVLLRDSLTIFLQLLMSAPNNLSICYRHAPPFHEHHVSRLDQFEILVQIVFNIESFKNLIGLLIERRVDEKDLPVSKEHPC